MTKQHCKAPILLISPFQELTLCNELIIQESLQTIFGQRSSGIWALTKSHARHLSATKCRDMGLCVEMIEEDQDLQDAILTVHHACIHTLASTPAIKMIENHDGIAQIQTYRAMIVPSGPTGKMPEFSE